MSQDEKLNEALDLILEVTKLLMTLGFMVRALEGRIAKLEEELLPRKLDA